MNTIQVNYKYYYFQSTNNCFEYLHYLKCMGEITTQQYSSLKNSPESNVQSFLHNNSFYYDSWKCIIKSESLNDLIRSLQWQIGDVLLLDNLGRKDGCFHTMKSRILSIANVHLIGAREQKNKIIQYLNNNILDYFESDYDSVYVRDLAIRLLDTYLDGKLYKK